MPAPKTSRSAALIAAAVAVPVALLVAIFMIRSAGGTPAAAPTPAASRLQPSAPVSVPAPQLDERAGGLCRALTARLPEKLRDLDRRPVTAGAEQNAAYGDPAITVTCGGTAPSIAPTDDVIVADGVCWHAAGRGAEGAVLTTADREVPVSVTVPARYTQAAQWANEFSGVIVQTVPATGAVPTGCKDG